MKIGYVRVSKQEQNEELQIDALKEAGCDKWFVDKMTGSKAERKGLTEALAYLRPGDTLGATFFKIRRTTSRTSLSSSPNNSTSGSSGTRSLCVSNTFIAARRILSSL